MNQHDGSTVESLFEDLGELSKVRLLAAKKILAEELRRLMAARSMSEAALARAMATSRTTVRRLLDPADTGVTLATLARAGAVFEQHTLVRFVGARPVGSCHQQVSHVAFTRKAPRNTRCDP